MNIRTENWLGHDIRFVEKAPGDWWAVLADVAAAMMNLSQTLREPARVDFIRANTIANKAISTRYGHPKMIKKGQMTPQMLIDRQPILEDTVELMGLVDKYSLPIKVSETIYGRYA